MKFVIQAHTELGQVPLHTRRTQVHPGIWDAEADNERAGVSDRVKRMQAFIDEHPEMRELFGIHKVDYILIANR
jgi:hypothetical protein